MNEIKHLPIEDTETFKRFVSLSNSVWSLARSWDRFSQDTVGRQMCRALDSVGANMAEGDGRYGDRESLQFFVVARGSAREAAYWIARASDRNLIPQNMRTSLEQELEHATKSLNALISYRRNRKVGAVQEEISEYSAT